MVKPIATFYLLPTRAWELLIGSVGALWLLHPSDNAHRAARRLTSLLFVPALLGLLLLPWMPFKGAHPGTNALLVCLATLVIILQNSLWLNGALATRLLGRVGDFSYSLYLVHWPIIAFMKNAWVGRNPELPLELRATALVLSFAGAYLLYRLVEDPIRNSSIRFSKPMLRKVVLPSALLVLITPMAMLAMPVHIDFKEARKLNYGFGVSCEYDKSNFVPKAECQSGVNPSLLVWGDSYAMHLVPGLADEWKSGGVVQATRSACGPFLGLAPHRLIHPANGGIVRDQAWAEGCVGFNQSVIEYLRANSSVEVVVLSSPFAAYVTQDNYEFVVQNGLLFTAAPVSATAAQAGLQRTVDAIRALGKKVVLIAPPPSSDFDIGGCLERQLSGNVAFGGRKGCAVDRADYLVKRADVLNLLSAVSQIADVAVIRFDSELCDTSSCQTLLDGTMIYRDGGHLSVAGSRLLAKRMHLAQLIRTEAR